MDGYRSRHYYLDAVRFTGTNLDEIAKFLGVDQPDDAEPADQLVIELPTGDRALRVGDYLVRLDGHDEYWTCDGEAFEVFFEPFDETDKISPPVESGDALAWALSFESHYPHSGLDAGLMVGWFANYWAACQAVTP